MVMFNVHEFLYVIDLSKSVDYYNVILQMQIDLRIKFEYNEKTNKIIVLRLPSNKILDRLENVTVWKNHDKAYMTNCLYLPNMNDSKFDDPKFLETVDKELYPNINEDIIMHRQCNKDFLLFKNEFITTDEESHAINGLLNHSLIKDLVIKSEWEDTVTIY